MKKHAIIPVFIPHLGCPNDCVFCNQKVITARTAGADTEDVRRTIEQYMSTLQLARPDLVELAFYGGSFTGLPLDEQAAFLQVAAEYKAAGVIDRIHLSTRPDYIDGKICDHLASFGVDTVELGIQSFDPEVLAASRRGHTAEDSYRACELVKAYGFQLGIQLMIGLPRDSRQRCIFSAKEAVRMEPAIARLYPTVVLEETELMRMYEAGSYQPLPQEEAVSITKDMYRILDHAGINIIRVGLKSSDLVREGGRIRGHTYHPAFRQLVEGQIAREDVEQSLQSLLASGRLQPGSTVELAASPASFSNLTGHQKCNRTYFTEAYPDLQFRFRTDPAVEPGTYTVVL